MFVRVNETIKINASNIKRAFIAPAEKGFYPYLGEVSFTKDKQCQLCQLSKDYVYTGYYSPGEFVVVIDTTENAERFFLYGEYAKKAWDML